MDAPSTDIRFGYISRLCRFVFLFSGILSLQAAADPLPLRMQAVLIEKILLFDRTLPANAPRLVVVVYGDELDQAEVLYRALTELRIKSMLVSGADLRPMPATQVVYVFPHAWGSGIRDWALQKHALSFTGEPATVRAGNAAVALSLEDRKPRILVNLTVAKAQGHDLSSELLQVATVVK